MIRIRRMHVRTKKCKKVNRKGSRHGGSEDKLTALPAWTEETSNSKNRAEHFKSTKDKDLDSASNLTSEVLEASTRVLDNINLSSRETALCCFQEQKCLDFAEKEATPPEDPPVHAVTGLAPEVHPNLAKSGEEKCLLASKELLKERMPDESPLTQGNNTVNSLHMESCIDPMLKNMLTSIVKAEDEDELVAEGKDTCGIIADTTTCKSIHIAKGYCDPSKTTPSSFQFSDMLYDKCEGEKSIESFTAEPGLCYQVAGKYRHASGTKLSHATCSGSHSADSSGFTKDIKVDKISLERFLANNSKIIKRRARPQKSGDSDILKQMGELNPGIINKLRNKKQVHAALGAIIGASTVDAEKKDPSLNVVENQQKTNDDENQGIDCDYEGRSAKRRKSNDFRLKLVQMNSSSTGGFAATMPLMDMKTQAVDMDTKAQATHMMAEVVIKEVYSTENLNSDSSKHIGTETRVYTNCSLQSSHNILKNLCLHKLENEPDISGAKQQEDSGADCLCDQTISCQQRSHTLLQVANKTTENAALCWLELLRLDIKGRLSALKRSRRRIRSVVVSGQLEDKMCCADNAFQKTSRWDMVGGGKRDSHTVEVDKWRMSFLHMDGVLHSEGARLENWLNQIDEMQSHCQKSTPGCFPLNNRK